MACFLLLQKNVFQYVKCTNSYTSVTLAQSGWRQTTQAGFKSIRFAAKPVSYIFTTELLEIL